MPNFIIIEQDQYKRMPWKNGLGETLEIQRHDDERGLRFRISQASVVENGVFSDFSGLHRTLVLLSGDGMTLEHVGKNNSHTNELSNALDIARFSGGDETHATLKNGKIEDLNIMVRDTDTQSDVSVHVSPDKIEVKKQDNNLITAFYSIQPCEMTVSKSKTVKLEANSFLIVKQNKTLCLTKGCGIFIHITDK